MINNFFLQQKINEMSKKTFLEWVESVQPAQTQPPQKEESDTLTEEQKLWHYHEQQQQQFSQNQIQHYHEEHY